MTNSIITPLTSGNLRVVTKHVYEHMELGEFLVRSGFSKFSVDGRTGILDMEYIDGCRYELEPSDMNDYYIGMTLLLMKKGA